MLLIVITVDMMKTGKSLTATIFITLAISVSYGLSDDKEYGHIIYIDNDSMAEIDDQKCLTSNNASIPCNNLTWVLQQEHNTSTCFVLLGEIHLLTASSTFQDLTTLRFMGEGGTVINCTGLNTGLAFFNVTDIEFYNITFHGCASLQNSTSRNYNDKERYKFELYNFFAGLYFFQCGDVIMTSLVVKGSPNAIGVVMYNTIGLNIIQDSVFERNRLHRSSDYPGGGGFYIEFTYCIPGDNTCEDFDDSIGEFNRNSQYIFLNTIFRKNLASNLQGYREKEIYIIPFGKIQNAFGKGGGANIIFKGNATNNFIQFSQCTFEENEATFGGGLLVEYQDNSGNNSVVVDEGTRFTGNKGKGRNTAGGGIRIGHYVTHTTQPGNRFSLEGCMLENNQASFGGGASVLVARQEVGTDSELFSMAIVNQTIFEGNVATVGAALECNEFSLFIRGNLPSLVISSTIFRNNSISEATRDNGDDKRIHEEGVGVVYTNRIPVWFQNEILFENNEGSALAVVGALVNFSNSNATFTSNTGKYGGAISILGSAYILVNNKTSMLFEDNVARVHGGAIANVFIERENFQMYPNCFIRYVSPFAHPDDWKAIFRFIRNRASLLGQSIYTTSIRPCTWAGGSGKGNFSRILCWEGWSYDGVSVDCHNQNQISTESGRITYTNTTRDDNDDHGYSDYDDELSSSIIAYPGYEFTLPLLVRDDLGRNITSQTVFTASTLEPELSRVNPSYMYVSEKMRLDGIGGNNITLQLHTDNVRTWQIEMDVELRKCPPGFISSSSNESSTTHCICNGTKKYNGKLHCTSDRMEARITNGYWFGSLPESKGAMVLSLCLPGFCKKDDDKQSLELPKTEEELDRKICHENRMGILCGKCREGLGPTVNRNNDYDCIPCDNVLRDVLIYIVSAYLPLLLLFLFIVVFCVRLTTGPANAFLFYAQVISSTFDLNADSHIPLDGVIKDSNALLSLYRVPYGIFNLDFVENFVPRLCFSSSPKFNALSVLMLDYIIALFPLFMILGIVIVVKIKDRFRCCNFSFRYSTHRYLRNWNMSESLLHGFAAFLLLSYTKFSLTSSYLVNIHDFVDAEGKEIGVKRAYYYGDYLHDNREYLYYYRVPGITVLILITIPPLVLLGYPVIWFEKCIIRIPFVWKWYPADKIQIFLDTFQGCYKDDRRFFAGMYFIFRLMINATYIITENWLQQFVAQQVICTIFMFLIACLWPYRGEQWYVNYVDFFIFTNLAIVNAISLFLFVSSQINPLQSVPAWPFYVQYVLVFMPLVYMILYVIWYFMKPSQKETLKKLVKMPLKRLRKRKRERFLKDTILGPSGGVSHTSTTPSQRYRAETVLNEDGIPTTELVIETDRDDSMSNDDDDKDIVSADSEDDLEAILVRAETQNTYRSTNRSVSRNQEASRLLTKDSGLGGTHRQLDSLVGSVKQNDLSVSLRNDFSRTAELSVRKELSGLTYGSLSA